MRKYNIQINEVKMKITILNFKRCICLLLSLFLFTLNIQLFAQEIRPASNIISQQEIEELTDLSKRITAEYNKTLNSIKFDANWVNKDPRKSVVKINTPYYCEDIFKSSYETYQKQINNLDELLYTFHNRMRKTYAKYLESLPEGTYLKKVTANYINEKMNSLFATQKRYMDNLISISDLIKEQPEIIDMTPFIKKQYVDETIKYEILEKFYKKDSRIRNSYLQDLAEHQTAFQEAFSYDMEKLIRQLKQAESSFSKEAVEFFSKKSPKPTEIFEYLNRRLPENQKALLFALKTSDEGLTIQHLIPYARYYLKKVNRRLWKSDKFSAENIAKIIRGMKMAERTKFIDNLLDFPPETLATRQEVKQLEKSVGKKLIDRGSIKLTGTFMAIGSLFVAMTITEIAADNNFFNNTYGYMADIKNKINEGQPIPLQQLLDYHINDRTAAELAKNPLAILEVLEIAITADEYLDSLGIEDNTDIPFINQEQKQEQINNVLNKYLKKVNLNKITAATGIL